MSANPNSIGEFNGIYRGLVIDNVDPQNKVRVKVRIRGLHDDDVGAEELPWAPVCAFPMGNLHGPIFIPNINQLVYIMFEQGHPEFPVVMGGVFTDLDTRNESMEINVAGDDVRVIEGQKVDVARDNVNIITSNSSKSIGGDNRYDSLTETVNVQDLSKKTYGRKETTVSGGVQYTIGATSETIIQGDEISNILGQCDKTVAGDDIKDVIGQTKCSSYNVSGTPLVDNAELREAINGFAEYIAKNILNIRGSSLKLDPVGLQTQLYSLINIVIKSVASVTIDSPLIKLGGAATIPITLLPHVHISPFLGLPTGPAVDFTGGFGIALGVLSGPPIPTLPET